MNLSAKSPQKKKTAFAAHMRLFILEEAGTNAVKGILNLTRWLKANRPGVQYKSLLKNLDLYGSYNVRAGISIEVCRLWIDPPCYFTRDDSI